MPRKNRLRYNSLFEGNFNAPDAPTIIRTPDSWDAINRLFYQRGWTDGLPVVPPTPDRFERMIKETGLDPETPIGTVEPRLGLATVGKVAINAIMAGCEAAHLPVVIAATRAMIQPQFNLKALQCTTHPVTVLTLVNGPIAHELDVNASYNCMGQGVLANAVIGRAIRLVMTNIGGAAPGILDRSTQGSPAKYAFCFAENEAENPWTPLHVERGFAASDSTVTVCGVEGPHNVNEHFGSTAEDVLLTVAGVLATPGSNNSYLAGENLIALGPEHAHLIAREGLTKDDIKQFMVDRAIIPSHHIGPGQRKTFRERLPHRVIGADGAGGMHLASAKEDIMVVVAGGAGRHSSVMPSFGTTRSVTVKIGG
ncbi:MAG TPA: hypothetical protein VMB81_12040 [Candidatus Sulfotelmatobacter sp.]|nr:hypothetical protein [Candidatus Sulfotelmatobacter sp.]